MRRLLIGTGVALLLAGYGWALTQIHHLETTEADVRGEALALADLEHDAHHALVAAHAHQGQNLIFEVCSEDGFENPAWNALSFQVWFVSEDDLVVSKSMADLSEHVVRADSGAGCVIVSRRDAFGVSGELALGMGWDTLPAPLRDVRAQGHVIAWTPIGTSQRASIWLVLLGALMLVAGLSWPPPHDALAAEIAEPSDPSDDGVFAPGKRLAIGLGALFGVMLALALVPLGGATMGLAQGLVIAGVEVIAAWWLVQAVAEPSGVLHRRAGLALVRPRFGLWPLLLAPVIAVLVWIAGRMLMTMVPSTGVAPIETFVAAPSGALAVGAIAVFVPIAEELFFRGFVYGTVDRARGANIATLVTIVLFAVVHLPQQWGAWGAFASVTMTGAVLTLLRRGARSTLLPVLVHLAHNAMITLLALG